VGLVFQHYALFRHMTVAENIGFGLRVRPSKDRPSASEIQSRVEKLLSLIQLEGLGDRYPAQLSGGQRQRVALARALAIEPRMLLLDEPFGALDAKVRRDLRRWLRQVHDETGVTTIFVTHDQEEALDLADRVAVMSQGKLEQMDTPETLYAHPNSAFVHGFLGSGVQLPGAVANGVLSVDGWSAPTDAPDGPAFLCARAEDFHAAETGLEARIEAAGARGDHVRIEAAVGEQVLELTRPSGDPLAQAPVNSTIRLAPKRFHVFPG
jgi:sulfate transport system ATP-binding protein